MTNTSQIIKEPYLIIVSCPFYDQGDGKLYVTDAWRRDLTLHFAYIRNMLLAGPVLKAKTGQTNLFELQSIVPDGVKLEAIRLPDDNIPIKALFYLPLVIARLWTAVRKSKIIHCDVLDGGHIYPYGLIAVPLAWLQKRFIINFVENVELQLNKNNLRLRSKLRSNIIVYLAKFCLSKANLVFTSYEESRDLLVGKDSKKTHIIPYVNLMEDELISEKEAEQLWDEKMRSIIPIKIGLASRLTASKGVGVLLDALQKIIAEDVPLEFDIYGAGELENECRKLEANSTKNTNINFKGTLPYTSVFFDMLKRYHLMVIPSLSDEQPILLFDCFSQATPVLASKTLGMAKYVAEGNGFLVEPGNVEELAAAIRMIANDPSSLRERSKSALRLAQKYNIQANHKLRASIIIEALKNR
jgi:glycosyltransferase involved in cell wall biosynthesis